MRKKTKENKEELKTGGDYYYVRRKEKKEKEGTRVPKVRHKFGPNGISAFFIPFFFLFSFEFCSDNFETVPLKNVCFSCRDFYDARRWCHDDFTHGFWGGLVGDGGTERKRRLNLPLV